MNEVYGDNMKKIIGVRREDKNIWERRVPIIPKHVKELKEKHNIETVLQSFKTRAFSDAEYIEAGGTIKEDLDECPIVFAVKEIPIKLLKPNRTYIEFSHTIKGQPYNMPMLQKLIDLKCTLIDYECIKDDKGRRKVFFGNYAGLAGMIDTFHGMGKRYTALGYETPFNKIKPAYEYADVDDAKKQIAELKSEFEKNEIPDELCPLVIGFAGYGNVSQGAQEIFDLLPHKEISPEELLNQKEYENNILYKVVFKEEHMAAPIDSQMKFVLQDYYDYPEKYKSNFEQYLKKLSVLVNAIYWDERYPRFVTKDFIKRNINELKLQVIGDITCDIDGAIEFTSKATESDNPAYVYNPDTDDITDGYEGKGVVDIAVDNLPTELPKDSSVSFSTSLLPFVPGIVNADLNKSFDDCGYPDEIKRAVILYKGELTPDFKYLQENLDNL
jgi:alpha-aminoadipic semialdehyde synthase